MALQLKTVTSSAVLNVSQDYVSSPVIEETQNLAIPPPKLPAGSAATSRVEDSYNETTAVPEGGAVQPPAMQLSNDELYEATPRKLQGTKKSSQRVEVHNSNPREIPESQPQEKSQLTSTNAVSKNSADHVKPANKAGAAQPAGSQRTPSNLKRFAQEALTEESHLGIQTSARSTTREAIRTSSNKITSTESARATSQTSAMSTPGAGQATGKLTRPTGGTSSLALLKERRAAREAAAAQTNGVPEPPKETSSKAGEARGSRESTTLTKRESTAKAQETGKTVPAEPCSKRNSKAAAPEASPTAKNRPVTGKQSLRKSMVADNPVSSKRQAAPFGRKRKADVNENAYNGEASKPTKVAKQAKTAAANRPRRSARTAGPVIDDNQDEDDDNYDVPVSSPKKTSRTHGKKPLSKASGSDSQPPPFKEQSQTAPGKLSKVSKPDSQPITSTATALKAARRSKPKNSTRAGSSSELEYAKSNENIDVEDRGSAAVAQPKDKGVKSRQQRQTLHHHPKAQGLAKEDIAPPVEQIDKLPAVDVGSQKYPEVITDGEEPSSPIPELSDEGAEDGQLAGEQPLQLSKPRPQTAAVPPSSPPLGARFTPGIRTGGLEETALRSHKSTVINFAKDGPRNQGTIGAKTPGAKSTCSDRYGRSSMPPTKIPLVDDRIAGSRTLLDVKRTKGPSSVATSVRTSKSTRQAEPSNVAPNVGDALEAVLGHRVNSPGQRDGGALLVPTKGPSQPQLASKEPTLDNFLVQPDEDGFYNIDNEHMPSPPPKEAAVATAMTGPKLSEKARDQVEDPVAEQSSNNDHDFVNIKKRKAMNKQPTATQASKSVATSKKSKSSVVQETKHGHKDSKNAHTRDDDIDGETLVDPGLPDQLRDVEDHVRIVESQQQMPPPPAPKAKAPRKKAAPAPTAEPQRAKVEKTAATHRPKRSAMEEEPPERAVKRAKAEGFKAGKKPDYTNSSANAELPPQRKRAADMSIDLSELPAAKARRVIRQTSQASQTVDIHGSPVPRDMAVVGRQTVLEHFSQQAEFTVNHVRDDDARVSSPEQTPVSDDQDAVLVDPYFVPTSYQPRHLSSNTKPLPDAPQAESKAMARVKLSEPDSRRLYERHDTASRMENPFESSTDCSQSQEQNQRASSGPLSGFQKRLQKQVNPSRVEATSAKSKVGPKTHDATVAPKQAKKAPIKTRPRAITRALAGKLDKQMGKLRELTEAVRAEEEDLEKTLVDRDDSLYEDADVTATVLPKSSPVSITSQSDVDASDLIVWTRSLHPHQLNVFDELVKCAQRLTMHFIKQENATDRILNDYHRRNAILIKEEQAKQAKRHEEKMSEVRQKEKEKKEFFKMLWNNVEDMDADLSNQREQRKTRVAAEKAANHELEQFMMEVW